MLKKIINIFIFLVFILLLILVVKYRSYWDKSVVHHCENLFGLEYVIVHCGEGKIYCTTKEKSEIIDCQTIAITKPEKDEWFCKGGRLRGDTQCSK